MPNDLRLQAAQAYIAQPEIQAGYRASSGGLGTVMAMVKAQPIETAQASISTTNRTRFDAQSSRIQSNVCRSKLFTAAPYVIQLSYNVCHHPKNTALKNQATHAG